MPKGDTLVGGGRSDRQRFSRPAGEGGGVENWSRGEGEKKKGRRPAQRTPPGGGTHGDLHEVSKKRGGNCLFPRWGRISYQRPKAEVEGGRTMLGYRGGALHARRVVFEGDNGKKQQFETWPAAREAGDRRRTRLQSKLPLKGPFSFLEKRSLLSKQSSRDTEKYTNN